MIRKISHIAPFFQNQLHIHVCLTEAQNFIFLGHNIAMFFHLEKAVIVFCSFMFIISIPLYCPQPYIHTKKIIMNIKSFTQCQFNNLFQHSWDPSQFQPKCCFEIHKFIIVERSYFQKKPMCEDLNKNEKWWKRRLCKYLNKQSPSPFICPTKDLHLIIELPSSIFWNEAN